ncbi:MAG: DUF4097 family beta strand repeat-containing protein [Steroidobacter sp.]
MKVLLSSVLVLQLAATPAGLAEVIEKRAPADARGEVEIVNVAGDVRVLGWERAEVQVNADLGSGVERLEFKRNGPHTLVKVVLPGGRSSSGSSDLVVRVPRDSAVAVKTVSADQTVQSVRGAQRLQSVSGNIMTENWDGEFEAKTVSGEIEVLGHGGDGPMRVTSVSGDVRLMDIGPELDLNTVTGDMDVRMDELTRVRIKTTNGDLELIGKLSPHGRIDAEAINGDLRFLLRGAIDAEFNIETFNGDIDNCFGPRSERTREFGPGNELRFTQGEGKAQVRIKTLNGGVEICKK